MLSLRQDTNTEGKMCQAREGGGKVVKERAGSSLNHICKWQPIAFSFKKQRNAMGENKSKPINKQKV